MLRYIFIFLLLDIVNLYADIGIVREIYFTPSDDCRNLIIKNIDNAKESVDVAIYSITDNAIADAIKRAHDKKINVRIIVDRLQLKNKGSKVMELLDYGVPVLISRKYRIEHNKFTVVDDKIVIGGSYNYTTNARKYNSENCLLIEDNELKYKNRFIQLWNFYSN